MWRNKRWQRCPTPEASGNDVCEPTGAARKASFDARADEPRIRRWPIAMTGCFILLAFILLYIFNPRFLNAVVLQSQDMLIARNAVPPKSGAVALVDIDDASLNAMGQWPWARFLVARMADNLWDAGAKLIVFDIGFPEADRLSPAQAIAIWREVQPDFDPPDNMEAQIPDFDRLLAESINRGPVVLGTFLHIANKPATSIDEETLPFWGGVFLERGRARHWLLQGQQLSPPVEALRENASIGFFNTTPDADNILRSTPLVAAIGDARLYPALGLEAVRMWLDAPRFGIHYDLEGVAGVRHIDIANHRQVPTDRHGRLTINFRSERFPTLRAMDVLAGDFDPGTVRDRIVVIGTSAIGLYDRYTTPLDEDIAGAEIQATIIDNILAGDMISEPRWMFFLNLAALFTGGILLIMLVARTRALFSLLVMLFALVYPVALSQFLLQRYQVIFVPTPLMIGWALVYAGIIVVKYWQQEIIAQYDARLRAVNRQLENEVEVRTRAEQDAQAARNAALRAASAKGEFLANMSHEIRTPMNSVIGMTDLALRTKLDERQRNYIGKVRYSAHALLRLINDILDFSKLEAGKMDVENVAFNLDTVIADVIDLLGNQAFKKNIDLILDFAPDVTRAVIGDPLRLRQVLINLAANAIKFTEKGYVCLRVSNPDRENSSKTLFEVIDTGIGLTPEQQAALFQAFSQADTSTTRKYGGTGLGLAISQNLVELMNGRIEISSQKGKGSNFHFLLPFEQQSDENEPHISLPDQLHGRRVLVAGTRDQQIAVIARDCRKLGLHAETIADPLSLPDRIDAAKREDTPWELVILDGTGIETGRLIESLPREDGSGQAGLPLILLGIQSMEQEAVPDTVGQNVYFLAKPVKPIELVSSLRIAWGHEPLASGDLWHSAETPSIAPERLKNARVLLVDDNAINREVATENMIAYGIVVEPAVNGREAIEKASTQPWNLILMDIQMPEIDGYEATRAIRDLEGQGRMPRKRTPILAMTASAMKEDEDTCLDCGMDDFLTKPLEIDAFLSKLLQYIPEEDIPLPGAPDAATAKTGDGGGPTTSNAAGDVIVTADSTGTAAQSGLHEKPQTSEQVGARDQDAADTPAIPGADVNAGLRRVRGNVRMYRRLLADFYMSHVNDPEHIREAMKCADNEPARGIAHAIKGSAANLGLTDIQHLATGIDQHFRQQQPDAAANLVTPLEQALAALGKAIAAHLPDSANETCETDATPAKPVSLPPALIQKTRRLRDELRLGNVDALEYLAETGNALREAGIPDSTIKAVTQAAETFDFESAAGLLTKIIDS